MQDMLWQYQIVPGVMFVRLSSAGLMFIIPSSVVNRCVGH